MGKSQKQEVTEYRLSMHMGVCYGPVDAVTRLKIGGKTVFQGRTQGIQTIDVYQPELFGGPTKEGGADGCVYILPGEQSQVLPDPLAARLVAGATGADLPAFRRKCTVFFVGAKDLQGSTSEVGESQITGTLFYRQYYLSLLSTRPRALASQAAFAWSHNNPYLKPVEVQVERIPKVLSPTYAKIENANDPDAIVYDANPAHIIYECLTDKDWGMGASPLLFDAASFEAAAATLFNEGFGLSFEWTRQSTIKAFIDQVIDHIQAVLFLHPQTGLWTLKLLRDDYDADALPSFDESNSRIESYSERLIGETINELTVKYTDFVNEKNDGVTIQDLGNIIAQGDVVSDTREYPGITKRDLAASVCARDLRSASAPLKSATVMLNRSGWDIVPGAVIKLSSVEHGFSNVIFRVLDINYGSVGNREIRVNLIEDVFALNYSAYVEAPPTLWQSSSLYPEDMTYVDFLTAPAYFTPRVQSASLEEPDAVVIVLASQLGVDTFSYDLRTEVTLDNGEVEYLGNGSLSTIKRGVLAAPLSAEAETIEFQFPAMTTGALIQENGFVVIGGDEATQEIAFLAAADDTLTKWTLKRGVLDTTPKAWPALTPIWAFDLDVPIDDPDIRAASAQPKYKLLSKTSLGTLTPAAATTHAYTVLDRPYRPIRPADARINGQAFGEFDGRGVATITATWATRNRLLEDQQVLAWTDAAITPEAGQTTTIELRKPDGALVTRITGLTGASYTFDQVYDFQGFAFLDAVFLATLDGVDSFQGHAIRIRTDGLVSTGGGAPQGFGYGFGLDYGGT